MGRSGAASDGRFVLSLLPFLLFLSACGDTEPMIGPDQVTFPMSFVAGDMSDTSAVVVLVREGVEWRDVADDDTELDDELIHLVVRMSISGIDYELLSASTWTTTVGFDPIMTYDWDDGRFTFVRDDEEFHGEGDFARFTLSQYSMVMVDAESTGLNQATVQNLDLNRDHRVQILEDVPEQVDTVSFQTWERLYEAE